MMTDKNMVSVYIDGEKESLLEAVESVVTNQPCTVAELTSAIYQLGRFASMTGISPAMVVGTLESFIEKANVKDD